MYYHEIRFEKAATNMKRLLGDNYETFLYADR